MTPEEELQHYRDTIRALQKEYAANIPRGHGYRIGYLDGLHWAITLLTGKHPQDTERNSQ